MLHGNNGGMHNTYSCYSPELLLLGVDCDVVVAGEVATGKNRQLASVDALAARDSMGAIPGIGDAVPTLPQGAFPHPSG